MSSTAIADALEAKSSSISSSLFACLFAIMIVNVTAYGILRKLFQSCTPSPSCPTCGHHLVPREYVDEAITFLQAGAAEMKDAPAWVLKSDYDEQNLTDYLLGSYESFFQMREEFIDRHGVNSDTLYPHYEPMDLDKRDGEGKFEYHYRLAAATNRILEDVVGGVKGMVDSGLWNPEVGSVGDAVMNI